MSDHAHTSIAPVISGDLAARSSALYLCMHLRNSGFHVAIFDPADGQVLYLHEESSEVIHPHPFSDVCAHLGKSPLAGLVFRRTTLSYESHNCALIPTGFVHPGKEAQWLHPGAEQRQSEIRSMVIPEAGITLVHQVPDALSSLGSLYPGIRIFPFTGLHLRYVWGHHFPSVDALYAFVSPGYLLITAFRGGVHQLTNSFAIQQEEDVLYFLSHCAIQLGIDLAGCQVVLSGPDARASLVSALSVYCNGARAWSGPPSITLPANHAATANYQVIIHPICAS